MTTLASTTDLLQLFGEPTRVRLVALLAREELSVAEIVGITELGQSTVSTHLGRLREAGVLRDRRAGASTYYAMNDGAMPPSARKIWELVHAEAKDAVLEADRERCTAVVRAREQAAKWPDAVAGQMERHYSPGRTWEATARGLIGLMRLGDVLDVGSGDGTIAQLIAPRAKSVTLVDRSEKMIAAARARLARAKNATCIVGDAHELPLRDASFDQVLLFNVLTHAHTPARVIAEAARVLRRGKGGKGGKDGGGDLAVITLDAHDHADVTAAFKELHAGFAPAQVKRWLTKAGLAVDHCEVTCREKRPPHFQIVTAFATLGPRLGRGLVETRGGKD
jgi:ArsR family transcriptional regulator